MALEVGARVHPGAPILVVSFRADLISTQARSEATDVDKELSVPMIRAENVVAGFALACKCMDAKCGQVAGGHR